MKNRPAYVIRPWVQWGALALFLVLYARTAYRGQDVLEWPVHLVFRLDPLALITDIASGRAPEAAAWLGGVGMLVVAAVVGRVFCGWLCPMGTTLEYLGNPLRKLFRRKRANYKRPPAATAPVLLTGLFAATLAGLPLLGLLDPLSVFLRSLTLAFFPAMDHAAKAVFGALMDADIPMFSKAVELGFEWSVQNVLLLERPAFLLAGLTALIFGSIFALELLAPRFWCSHLCPLGALLGVFSRLSPFRRSKSYRCGPCRKCEANCPTAAAFGDPADPALCVQCITCSQDCPNDAMVLERHKPKPALPTSATRRAVIGSVALGVASAAGAATRAEERERDRYFLRPPGASEESEFNRRCIRCGACMRVCPRSALHPSLGEAGLGGIWSPRLVPRLGYCEYHCRLCGQVCPTGAINQLEEGDKEKFVIGLAVFDKNNCLPYRDGTTCIVCEEHCPISPKAIVFEEREAVNPEGEKVMVKFPKVVADRCNGCGICENKCPLVGKSAVRVTREKERGEVLPY